MATREDEVVLDIDKPEAQYVEPEDEGFEIVSEDDERAQEFVDKAPAEPTEAEKKLEEMQAQFAALQQKADAGTQVASGFDQLGEVLQKLQKPQQPAPAQIDWEAKAKELKEMSYDDPVKAQLELLNLTYGPQLQQLQQKLDATERRLAKQDTLSSERNKMIYDTYKNEVEEYAQAFSSDPDAYKKALAMVGMNHFDDLLEKEQAKKQAAAPQPSKDPGFNAYGTQQTPPVRKPKGIVLKAAEKREFDNAFGISPFTDKKYFYENIWLPNRQK